MKNDQPKAISLGDLAQMTLRANVVFAVRCAQRLRGCFDLPADLPDRREKTAAVDAAIRVAAAFGQGLAAEPGRAAATVRVAALVAEETCEFTSFAGYAAVRAAQAAAYAEEFVQNPSDSHVMEVVAAAFGAGRVLAANVDAFTLDLVVAALLADAEKLRILSPGTSQDLGLPVDSSEHGPLGSLWPTGTPAWFVAIAPEPIHAVE